MAIIVKFGVLFRGTRVYRWNSVFQFLDGLALNELIK